MSSLLLSLVLSSSSAHAACVISALSPSTGSVITSKPTFTFTVTTDCLSPLVSIRGFSTINTPTVVGSSGSDVYMSFTPSDANWDLWTPPRGETVQWSVTAAYSGTILHSSTAILQLDLDGDGWTRNDGDDGVCDDDVSVNPGEAEICDGIDNNCDGVTDPGCTDPSIECDGVNTGSTYSDGTSMGGPNLILGMQYTPTTDMDLSRIEVFTGEGSGTNTVAIWTTNPTTGFPSAEITSGSWSMSTTNGWQGADLDTCVSLTAGTTYWLAWEPINGSQATWDTSGTYVTYSGSFDGGYSWNGPWSNFVKYRLYCCS